MSNAETTDGLEFDKSLISYKGVIDRITYFTNSLIYLAIMVIPLVVAMLLFASSSNALVVVGILVLLCTIVPLVVISFGNHYRRLRDIRGTRENEVIWFVAMTLLMLVPYLSFVLGILLVTIPGAITSNRASVLAPVSKAIGQGGFSISIPKGKDENATSKIKELHELKESGALSEEEFVAAKAELLKTI